MGLWDKAVKAGAAKAATQAEKEAAEAAVKALAKKAEREAAEAASKVALKETRGAAKAAGKELKKAAKGSDALALQAATDKKRLADEASQKAIEQSKRLAEAKRVAELRKMAVARAPEKAAEKAKLKAIKASEGKISRLEALKAKGTKEVPFIGKDGKHQKVSVDVALQAEKNNLKTLNHVPWTQRDIKAPNLFQGHLRAGLAKGGKAIGNLAGGVVKSPVTKYAAVTAAVFAVGKFASAPIADAQGVVPDSAVASNPLVRGEGVLVADNSKTADYGVEEAKWDKTLAETDTKTDEALKASEHKYNLAVNTGVAATVYDPESNTIAKADTSNMSLLWKTVSARFREGLIGKSPEEIAQMTGAGKGDIVAQLRLQVEDELKKAGIDPKGSAKAPAGVAMSPPGSSQYLGDKVAFAGKETGVGASAGAGQMGRQQPDVAPASDGTLVTHLDPVHRQTPTLAPVPNPNI